MRTRPLGGIGSLSNRLGGAGGGAAPSADFTGGPLVISLSGALTATLTNTTTGEVGSHSWQVSPTGAGTWTVLETTKNLTDFDFAIGPIGVYDIRLIQIGPGGSDTEAKTGYLELTA